MKVTVLIPSEAYKATAGARIRYGRLSPALAEMGVILSLQDISHFEPRTAECDALIISKCYDARSLLAAKIVSARGARIGVDLFDDYFSQHADSRLNRYRLWLGQMLAMCDFALCSTPAMARVIETYPSDKPVHILNDPAPEFDLEALAASTAEKLSLATSERLIRLAWFGLGDNPHFPVGLSDVSAFSDTLARLHSSGMAVELTILTNARSLDAARLSMIRELALDTFVDEWSEAAEAQLLRDSFACFLPVNAQSFSTAKSLNRAVTALAAGCQIISSGYPLYAPLDAFIYRDPAGFTNDLRDGRMRFSEKSLPQFHSAIAKLGSSRVEAAALVEFLRRIRPAGGDTQTQSALYLVHGFATHGAAETMVHAAGGLSIKTPFCRESLSFDVIFEAKLGGALRMLVSEKVLGLLLPELRSQAFQCAQIDNQSFWEVRDQTSHSSVDDVLKEPSLALLLSLYPTVMQTAARELAANFGPGQVIVSETSALPFEIASA